METRLLEDVFKHEHFLCSHGAHAGPELVSPGWRGAWASGTLSPSELSLVICYYSETWGAVSDK